MSYTDVLTEVKDKLEAEISAYQVAKDPTETKLGIAQLVAAYAAVSTALGLGGAGGGGAVTVADGANVTLGAKADAEAGTDTGTFSLIGLFKRLLNTKLKQGFQLISASLAVTAARPQPTTIATPHNGTVISSTSAATDQNPIKIDLDALNHQGFLSINVTLVNNATAPGASRTVTLFYAFSQSDLTTLSDAPVNLSTRESNFTCNIANTTSATREYDSGKLEQLGRYLYVWYDASARDASSQTTLTTRVIAL